MDGGNWLPCEHPPLEIGHAAGAKQKTKDISCGRVPLNPDGYEWEGGWGNRARGPEWIRSVQISKMRIQYHWWWWWWDRQAYIGNTAETARCTAVCRGCELTSMRTSPGLGKICGQEQTKKTVFERDLPNPDGDRRDAEGEGNPVRSFEWIEKCADLKNLD